ncbi:hypothetical protein DJ82_03155 [Halorubrum sp. Ib24]|uniref:hypothetical protein n=1 Tax=Halorubrum sp. Ib24 TaxID=1383850 RepID=UPI000B995ECE|nr:hypothetical protein [Halorubrum sp. Ib24]OYR42217.1 hypothetical protein DJ82_03155 [Halorubrum sp. Ib24]
MLRPVPFLGGAAVAVFVEVTFARWPERTTRLWRHPAIRFGSPLALLAATLSVGRRSGAPHAATLGGLAGYFALLIGITTDVVPEPKQWFRRSVPDERRARDDVAHGAE